MGLGAGVAGSGYGAWGSMGAAGGGPFPGYIGMPRGMVGTAGYPAGYPPNVLAPPVYDVLAPPIYDGLGPLGPSKAYKEGVPQSSFTLLMVQRLKTMQWCFYSSLMQRFLVGISQKFPRYERQFLS